MGKTTFFFPFVFDTNFLDFYSFFKGLLMLSFVLFPFFKKYHYFVFFVHPQKKIIACLLKGKN